VQAPIQPWNAWFKYLVQLIRITRISLRIGERVEHSFDIDIPTFAPQHDVNSRVAKPWTIVCDLSYPHAQTLLTVLAGSVVPRRFRKSR
jgi:hypothetical protein